MDENFTIEYSKFLDASKEHLTYEAIALYINFSGNFSRKELKFFEDHIAACNNCRLKFNELFDEDITLDDKAKNIELKKNNIFTSEKDYKKFISDDNNIELVINRDKESNLNLIFNRLGNGLSFSNIKISLENNIVLARIVAAETGKRNKILNKDLDISGIEKLSISYIQTVKAPEEIKEKKNPKIYWIAAASIVLITFLLYFLFKPEEPVKVSEKKIPPKIDTSGVIAKTDTTVKEVEQIKVPVPPEFAANNVLENFINRNIRSEGGVKIISPEIGDTVKTHLHFEWSPDENADEYTIEIVDNKNRFVWEKRVDYNQVTFLDKLEPGLYYWKIKFNGRMRAAGKFFVNN